MKIETELGRATPFEEDQTGQSARDKQRRAGFGRGESDRGLTECRGARASGVDNDALTDIRELRTQKRLRGELLIAIDLENSLRDVRARADAV